MVLCVVAIPMDTTFMGVWCDLATAVCDVGLLSMALVVGSGSQESSKSLCFANDHQLALVTLLFYHAPNHTFSHHDCDDSCGHSVCDQEHMACGSPAALFVVALCLVVFFCLLFECMDCNEQSMMECGFVFLHVSIHFDGCMFGTVKELNDAQSKP